MENRITTSICDEEYTFVAEEAPSYMQKVGSYVNERKMRYAGNKCR